jgi:hypothetical protein
MTAKTIETRFNVNVMRIKQPIKKGVDRSYWIAFRGGNGTGEPVVDIAEARTLVTLAVRVERALAKSAK